jgi:NADH-quinone oxidoreductase subunit K
VNPWALLPLAAVSPAAVLYLAAALFAVGLVGVSCRRNVIIMLLSVEILLNAANLAFVAFSRVHGDVTGQVFVFFAMAIAAAEVAVGLAIVIAGYRLRRNVNADGASDLRERHVGEVPPIQVEGQDAPHHDEEPGSGHGGGHGDPHAPSDDSSPHAVAHGAGHAAAHAAAHAPSADPTSSHSAEAH